LRFAAPAASTSAVIRLLCLLLVGALALGCGASQATSVSPQHYQENARRAYAEALEQFEDHDWENATSMFEQVKRQYAYTRYARLAELRLADIAYAQDNYAESVTGYRSFAHDHPNDPLVAYARFRICKALFEQSGETILLPPQEERDLASALDAFTAMKAFLDDFPMNDGVPEVTYMLEVISGLLARHELYVAHFYLKQGHFEAAAARCRYELEHYRDSGLSAEALVLLGETYLKMHRRNEAREAFLNVLSAYPGSAFTVVARRFLRQTGLLVSSAAE